MHEILRVHSPWNIMQTKPDQHVPIKEYFLKQWLDILQQETKQEIEPNTVSNIIFVPALTS